MYSEENVVRSYVKQRKNRIVSIKVNCHRNTLIKEKSSGKKKLTVIDNYNLFYSDTKLNTF